MAEEKDTKLAEQCRVLIGQCDDALDSRYGLLESYSTRFIEDTECLIRVMGQDNPSGKEVFRVMNQYHSAKKQLGTQIEAVDDLRGMKSKMRSFSLSQEKIYELSERIGKYISFRI